jgi:hypothetical protein
MMKFERTLTAAVFLVAASLAALSLILSCRPSEPMSPIPVNPERQYGPPVDTPTLDYEKLTGLDPLTQNVMDERARLNDLEFRVQQLEKQTRQLNQLVRGVPAGLGSETPEGDDP